MRPLDHNDDLTNQQLHDLAQGQYQTTDPTRILEGADKKVAESVENNAELAKFVSRLQIACLAE